jgi:uncharacterized protein (TIGR01777 family)
MKVVVTGATGMIGRAVVRALLERGDEVVALSRDIERGRRALGTGVAVHAWADPLAGPPPAQALSGAGGVVNLLGEPIAQRWTEAAKDAIRDSRVLGTRHLVAGLQALPAPERPGVLVSQSATGFYGPRGEEIVDETAGPGTDFLAEVVVDWEREAHEAASICRVVLPRTGVVLSAEGGALGLMLPFFRLGLGGPVAGGRQYVPWIHLDDVVGGLLAALDSSELSGPINLTAPSPVNNRDFSRALGRALGRPAVLPVPGFALGVLYGEMAQVVTTGQCAVPAVLQRADHRFAHPEIEPALRDLVGRR